MDFLLRWIPPRYVRHYVMAALSAAVAVTCMLVAVTYELPYGRPEPRWLIVLLALMAGFMIGVALDYLGTALLLHRSARQRRSRPPAQ